MIVCQITLFNVHFTVVQFCALGFIFCLYFAQGVYIIKFKVAKKKPEEKEAVADDEKKPLNN